MSLTRLGEDGVIALFAARAGASLPEGVLGIGDDCAVLPGPEGSSLLVTTDLLVEGVHFLWDRIDARDLGHRTAAVNLSDIAAMGGRPESAFLSLALPSLTLPSYVAELADGLCATLEAAGARLLGGDTSRSPGPLFINLTLVGQAPTGQVKRRSGARPGDWLAVTGPLGDSAAGLRLLEAGRGSSDSDPDLARLVSRHLRPVPRLLEGRFLGGRREVRAMMDLSDGLVRDLGRILVQSGVGARLDLGALPCSPALARVGRDRGWDLTALGAAGGEDYELLVCVEAQGWDDLAHDFEARCGRPLSRVGEVLDVDQGLICVHGGHQVPCPKPLFEHFM